MGFGIYLYPEIYYSKPRWSSLYELNQEIESIKRIIDMLKKKLAALAMMTEPRKMMPDDQEDPMWWVQREVDDILNDEYSEASLEYYYRELFKLELMRDNWDKCHKDSIAIAPPKGSFTKTEAYMTGDFVDSDYEDGTEHYRCKSLL